MKGLLKRACRYQQSLSDSPNLQSDRIVSLFLPLSILDVPPPTKRVLGTALGGLVGWLGVVVASGSGKDDAPINPFGLVVWLTVFTAIGASRAIDPGFMALMGASKQKEGYVGVYFIITMYLVGIEAYHGDTPAPVLALNRIASNAAGIVLAMVLVLTPPCRF